MDPVVFRLRMFLLVMLGIMVLATLGFMVVEGLSLGDAAYFSLVSITTVGYGDISPKTPWGKVLAIIVIVGGVGTFTGLLANATEFFLSKRDKRLRAEKQNTIVGLFFSEIGIHLLSRFLAMDPQRRVLEQDFEVSADWSEEAFALAADRLGRYDFQVDLAGADLVELRDFLEGNRTLFIRLLENPSLTEHGPFTDLLRAVLHLREELVHREHLDQLSETDRMHLGGDIKRAYKILVERWLEYMAFLKENYAYLFSLAARRNPFVKDASVEFQ